MRLFTVAILSVASLCVGVSAAKPAPATEPFTGAWMSCETYQGSEICDFTQLAQRGNRVCGVQRYFATNAYYEQRFVGTAKANVVQIEKICGDPGSETNTYCTGRAPSDAANVGWEATDEKLFLCNGRLLGASSGEAASCAKATRQSGVPRVRKLGNRGPDAGELAWLASCAGGAE